MQLDELIDKQTIESIAQKTNITAEVISRLQNRDFAELKKTQALGAISILEREFNIDLSPLRQECKTYFEDKDALENGVTALKPIAKDKRSYSRIASFLLLILLASGAWYFFTEYYEKKVELLDGQENKTLAGMKNTENETEGKIARTGEEVMAGEPVSKEAESKSETLKIADVADVKTAPEKSGAKEGGIASQAGSSDQAANRVSATVAPVAEEPKRAERSLEESLKEDLSELEEMAKSLEAEKNDSTTAETLESVEIAVADTKESLPESVAKEQNEDTAVPSESVAETRIETVATVDSAAPSEQNETETQVPVIVRESIILLPEKRMWFRLINLDTKKAREFKRRDRYTIDLREHDWLFATQNAQFSIIDGDMLEEYSGTGKLFFRFDQNGIHQLSEEEYRAAEK